MDLFKKIIGSSPSIIEIEYVGGYTEGFVGLITDKSISLTSLTNGLDTSPSTGDIVIIGFTYGDGATRDMMAMPTGYTALANLIADNTYDINFITAYKYMGTTPDTSITLPGGTGSTSNGGTVAVSVWRGVQGVVPTNINVEKNIGPITVLPNPPSITPNITGSVVVAVGAGSHTRGIYTFSSSDLDNFITVGIGDTYDSTIGMGSKLWESGTIDPAAWTFGSTDSSAYTSGAVTFALIPKNSIPINNNLYLACSDAFTFDGSVDDLEIIITNCNGIVSSASENDITIISFGAIQKDTTPTVALPSGWTQITDGTAVDVYRTKCITAYKICGTTAESFVTLTGGTSSSVAPGFMMVQVWKNIDPTTPLDVTPQLVETANTIELDPAAITPSTAGSKIAICGAGAHNEGVHNYSASELSNFKTANYITANGDSSIGIGTYDWTSGEFDPAAWVFSGGDSTAYSSCVTTIALRPD